MQAVVQVALEGPGELRVLDIARVDRRIVGVEPGDGSLSSMTSSTPRLVLARGETQQRVIVAASSAWTFSRGVTDIC